MTSVEEFLAQLQGEGQWQSAGQFTLDARRLRERLLHYRLTNPWLYQLFLIRAGVAGGAGEVRRILSREFCATYFELDCPPLEGQQMARLCEPSLVHQEETSLSYLARALEAALALRKSIQQVRIRSGGLQLSVKPGGDFELQCDDSQPFQGIEFRLSYSWLRAIWIAGLEGWNSSGHYGYARIPVISDGAVENRPPGAAKLQRLHDGSLCGSWSSPSSSWVRVAWADDSVSGWIPYFGGEAARHVHLLSAPDAIRQVANSECAASVDWMQLQGLPARRALAVLWPCSELRWVLDGVVVEREPTTAHPRLGQWGGVVVADGLKRAPDPARSAPQVDAGSHHPFEGSVVAPWNSCLKLDLGGTRLIRDEAFQRRQQWLQSLLSHDSAATP